MNTVTEKDIIEGFRKLGLIGKRVIAHTSLKSFGHIDGGADTLLDAMMKSFKTVMLPAFCWDSNTAPPEGDRPEQNGTDYSFYDNWQKEKKPFIVETAGIENSMGILSKKFINIPNVFRSDHPWHSWAAYGDDARKLTENHTWDTTNLPVERMAKLGGYVLLLGVGLKSCTAIHVSEERAGRNPIYRWAFDRNGQVKRVRACGCSKGFDNLMPHCKDLFIETNIGECRAMTAPLNALIERAALVIRSNPEITRCSPECIRCRDLILGGPK